MLSSLSSAPLSPPPSHAPVTESLAECLSRAPAAAAIDSCSFVNGVFIFSSHWVTNYQSRNGDRVKTQIEEGRTSTHSQV